MELNQLALQGGWVFTLGGIVSAIIMGWPLHFSPHHSQRGVRAQMGGLREMYLMKELNLRDRKDIKITFTIVPLPSS